MSLIHEKAKSYPWALNGYDFIIRPCSEIGVSALAPNQPPEPMRRPKT
jgi:hypothetical protein